MNCSSCSSLPPQDSGSHPVFKCHLKTHLSSTILFYYCVLCLLLSILQPAPLSVNHLLSCRMALYKSHLLLLSLHSREGCGSFYVCLVLSLLGQIANNTRVFLSNCSWETKPSLFPSLSPDSSVNFITVKQQTAIGPRAQNRVDTQRSCLLEAFFSEGAFWNPRTESRFLSHSVWRCLYMLNKWYCADFRVGRWNWQRTSHPSPSGHTCLRIHEQMFWSAAWVPDCCSSSVAWYQMARRIIKPGWLNGSASDFHPSGIDPNRPPWITTRLVYSLSHYRAIYSFFFLSNTSCLW